MGLLMHFKVDRRLVAFGTLFWVAFYSFIFSKNIFQGAVYALEFVDISLGYILWSSLSSLAVLASSLFYFYSFLGSVCYSWKLHRFCANEKSLSSFFYDLVLVVALLAGLTGLLYQLYIGILFFFLGFFTIVAPSEIPSGFSWPVYELTALCMEGSVGQGSSESNSFGPARLGEGVVAGVVVTNVEGQGPKVFACVDLHRALDAVLGNKASITRTVADAVADYALGGRAEACVEMIKSTSPQPNSEKKS